MNWTKLKKEFEAKQEAEKEKQATTEYFEAMDELGLEVIE